MITLITGLPGNGKTLWTLQHVKALAEKDQRLVFYVGIPALTLPWNRLETMAEWLDIPDGSILVVDEAQMVDRLPKRGNGNPPKYVESLATHRHRGIDIFLITQHPLLIDSFARRLCEDHFHLVRTFGAERATVHKFTQVKDYPDKSRDGSMQSQWSFPRDVYSYYKSAEVHTHKRKIPARVWILLSVPFLVAAFGYLGFKQLPGQVNKPVTDLHPASHPEYQTQALARSPDVSEIDAYRPRIPGLEYTAPRYDQVNQPQTAPRPSVCISTPSRCTCYTDQATRLGTPDPLCRQIAASGYFDDTRAPAWKTYQPQQTTPQASPEPRERAGEAPQGA